MLKNMSKKKKILLGFLISLFILIWILGIVAINLLTPTLTIDFSKQSKMTGRASGFLYGFAEADIPSEEIAESIGVNILSTKPAGGLQHPIGDVMDVSETFYGAGGELIVIYTQDMYDTWYYKFDSLPAYNDRVKKTITEMEQSPYKDKFAYCIYNEMDNGIWFGNHWEEANRYKFYDAWLSTYNIVKSINPDAKIAGPGHAGYNKDFIKEFLTYCRDNNCLPEIVVWHELSDQSIYWMDTHFNEYYAICDELGIERIPVCISEYGLMKTNGLPGESVKWISRLEKQDAYGCIAYWRLANNLAETVADDVTPNSNYWVYNFYAKMKGKELAVSERDLLHSNLGNYLKGKYPLLNKGFIGCSTFDETEKKFYILAGGSETTSKIKIENIDEKFFKNGDKVTVTVKYVDYKGLGGAVVSPEELMVEVVKVRNNTIEFKIPCERESQAYFIEITPYNNEAEYKNEQTFDRYEAEEAILNGGANATDQIAYACSENRVVKGIDKKSYVEFTVKVNKSGKYNIDFVYGNGPVGDRITANVKIIINGQEQMLKLPSTIKEDYMECVNGIFELNKGKNIIRLQVTNDCILSLDFIDVTNIENLNYTYFEKLNSRNVNTSENSYSVVVANDGYYSLSFDKSVSKAIINGYEKDIKNCVVYLHRGYNKVTLDNAALTDIKVNNEIKNLLVLTPSDVNILGGATVEDDAFTTTGQRIGWIASDNGGYCSFNVNAPKSGYYSFTVEYANNEEGGFHDYNVDLIERYIAVSVNGEKHGNYFFRSTYSWENYKTTTIVIYLNEGNNEITFANDGSYSFNNRVTYAPNIGKITVNY